MQNEISPKKVWFCDFAPAKYDSLIKTLNENNINTQKFTNSELLLKALEKESADICVFNLLVGGMVPYEIVEKIKTSSKNQDMRLIVVSKQTSRINTQNAIKAGANDYVLDPFDNKDFFNRILYHLTPKKVIDPLNYEGSKMVGEEWPYINLLLETVEMLSKTVRGEEHNSFFKIVSSIAKLLNSNRTSFLVIDEENKSGFVLASSDKPDLHDFPISLLKYPEVLHVINSGHFVLIDDISQNPLTRNLGKQLKNIEIGSMMVLPLTFEGNIIGALSIRKTSRTELPPMHVIRILQAIANIVAGYSNRVYLLKKLYRTHTSK